MISIVVPVYNEEEIIPLLHRTVAGAMDEVDEDWEVVYVNDGSKDSSLELLREEQSHDPRIVVVNLSRNFGHMGALSAGLRTASGDAVVLMDADLQDPPTVIPEFIAAWRNGAEVVAAVRKSREEGRKVLAVLFPLFYRVLGALSDYPIPLDSGIFGLLDRKAVDAINSLREHNRYLPGLRAWVGYRTAVVYYDRQDRIGGEGKLTFLSRIKYAMDAITSFSYKPLRLSFALSGLTGIAALILAIIAIATKNPTVALGCSIALTVCLVGGLLLVSIGFLGEYIGRIYDEVRNRPLSIISEVDRATPSTRQRVLTSRTRIKEEERQPAYPAA
jgi:glycosyltransferase involved in cell wall biosynthesis